MFGHYAAYGERAATRTQVSRMKLRLPQPDLHGFVDESTRRGDYMLCAATVAVGDLTETRKALRGLRAKGQRKLHFATESDPNRRKILAELGKLNASTIIYVAQDRNEIRARNAILSAMVPDLRARGVSRLMIDAREGQDHRDRATIHKAVSADPSPEFRYDHQQSAREPLLWIPDAVAWSWGRGGDWRVRVEGLVVDVIRIHG